MTRKLVSSDPKRYIAENSLPAQELKVFDEGLLKVFIHKQVSLILFDAVDVCLDVTNMLTVRKHD